MQHIIMERRRALWCAWRASFYAYPGYVEVTVGAMTGTGAAVHTYDFGRAGVFSFDAPVVSGVMLNAPHSGDGSVTVRG